MKRSVSTDYERKRRDLESDAAKLGHVPTVKEVSLYIDGCACSCGWKSREYWDGAEFAYEEWQRHVRDAIAVGQHHMPFAVPKAATPGP